MNIKIDLMDGTDWDSMESVMRKKRYFTNGGHFVFCHSRRFLKNANVSGCML